MNLLPLPNFGNRTVNSDRTIGPSEKLNSVTIEEKSYGSPLAASPTTATDNLGDLMEGAEVGLALFDSSLALISCNSYYANLFGYQPSDVLPGTPLNDLIRLNLEHSDKSPDKIENRIALETRRLQPGKIHSFKFRTSRGREVKIARNCLAN